MADPDVRNRSNNTNIRNNGVEIPNLNLHEGMRSPRQVVSSSSKSKSRPQGTMFGAFKSYMLVPFLVGFSLTVGFQLGKLFFYSLFNIIIFPNFYLRCLL